MRQTLRWISTHKLATAGLLILAFVGWELLSIPFLDVPRLARENPRETALMRQRAAEADAEGKRLKTIQYWIPLSKVPPKVVQAIVVAEDGSFYSHNGFDWFEVRASISKNWRTGRLARGASTITQQLAKNLYLSTSKNPVRKIREFIITLLLEHYLSKQRILELYVNAIEWGSGIYGIEAAARTYFGKSASNLTLEEGARLAAVIPSPLKHRPDSNSRYVLRMKQIVLNRLQARTVGVEEGLELEDLPNEEDVATERPAELDSLPNPGDPDTTESERRRTDGL